MLDPRITVFFDRTSAVEYLFGEWSEILDREYARSRFATIPLVVDCTDGFAALRLYQTLNGCTTICAEIVFWDACGQFVLQTFGKQVPLEIIEELISEAKDKIKVR